MYFLNLVSFYQVILFHFMSSVVNNDSNGLQIQHINLESIYSRWTATCCVAHFPSVSCDICTYSSCSHVISLSARESLSVYSLFFPPFSIDTSHFLKLHQGLFCLTLHKLYSSPPPLNSFHIIYIHQINKQHLKYSLAPSRLFFPSPFTPWQTFSLN